MQFKSAVRHISHVWHVPRLNNLTPLAACFDIVKNTSELKYVFNILGLISLKIFNYKFTVTLVIYILYHSIEDVNELVTELVTGQLEMKELFHFSIQSLGYFYIDY